MFDIGQNAMKSSGGLRRVAVTLTPFEARKTHTHTTRRRNNQLIYTDSIKIFDCWKRIIKSIKIIQIYSQNISFELDIEK